MARKHKHEEHENHERWLVSYADFITLLFAFFVVMYSVSAINEGKFRTVSESIKAALNPIASQQISTFHFNFGDYKSSLVPSLVERKGRIIRTVEKVIKKIDGDLRVKSQIVATPTQQGILITIPDHLLFESGQADVNPGALPILEALATVLSDAASDIKEIRVQGHTDNVPIRTALIPSNWELSASRAVTVVRLLAEQYGVPADKISASGHGEFKPVADNLTPEARAKNRRVEVLLITEDGGTASPSSRVEVSQEGPTEPPSAHPTDPAVDPIPSVLQPPLEPPVLDPGDAAPR